MTQVQLTNQELNRKLAELMGYTVKKLPIGDNGRQLYALVTPTGRERLPALTIDNAYLDAPDYAGDPAASLEVQEKAIELDARLYAINLAKRLDWDGDGDPLGYDDNDLFSYTGVTIFLLASPRERAEAAWMTIQGAKGDD